LYIDGSAFAQCSSLASISIPSTVQKLGRECFGRCGALQIVTFESGSRPSCIEDRAFSDCPSLGSICIPSSLEPILNEYRPILKVIVPKS
jgi:hypothetical protein